MSEMNLKKAYSSTLSLVEHNGRKFVKKYINAEEIQNELFFFNALKRAHLDSLEAIQEKDGLLVEFLESSTLQDSKTAENYYRFGCVIRKMHDILFSNPFMIDGGGVHHAIAWKVFIENQIQSGSIRQKERSGFSEAISQEIIKGIRERLSESFFGPASLLHCDLHQNNVLLSDQRLLLIDKGSVIAAGDSLYDIALVSVSLPGSILETDMTQKELFHAFIRGYGSEMLVNQNRFKGYVLLRALERWPNPFEQEIPDIVEKILRG